MKIVDIAESTCPIKSDIRNAYIDFSKMTLSLVAVVTDVIRDGKPVIGYGFNSNGRYGQGGLIRDRFRPRVLEADPASLLDATGDNLDPHKVWAQMMINEKPGGHGERSVAVGTIDMAVWDAVAKIANQPLYQLLAERYGTGTPNPRVFVYAAGGYYYPGKGLDGSSPWMPTVASTWPPPWPTRARIRNIRSSGTRRPATRSTTRCRPSSPPITTSRWPPARTCSRCRTRAT